MRQIQDSCLILSTGGGMLIKTDQSNSILTTPTKCPKLS